MAPAQSHGWRVYADFLLSVGRRRIAVATQSSVYWTSGTRVLRDHLAPRGGTVLELDASLTPEALCDALVDHGARALLLLVGHPEPAMPIVRAVRSDRRLAKILIGAPAGQPEFAEWAAALGENGAGIPFLRYLPERLGPLGERVGKQLRERLGEAPLTAIRSTASGRGGVSWSTGCGEQTGPTAAVLPTPPHTHDNRVAASSSAPTPAPASAAASAGQPTSDPAGWSCAG